MSELIPQYDPVKISYHDDEVRKFHPLVETKLKDYMMKNNLDSKYALEHHPNARGSGIPDFVIVQKDTGKWVYVIEVKRTPASVRSVSNWDQARNYVTNNRIEWAHGSKPYFMVTNMELNYFLCDRANESIQFCLLKKGEESCSKFGTDATDTLQDFEAKVLPKIFRYLNEQTEEYSDNLKIILDEFASLQKELSSHISKNIQPKIDADPQKFGFSGTQEYWNKIDEWMLLNDPNSREVDHEELAVEVARDSLLRIFIYEYCREFFKDGRIVSTSLKPITTSSQSKMKESIKLALRDLGKIDFAQIIKTGIVDFVPENMDDSTFQYFKGFLKKIHQSMKNAIKENGTIAYMLNMVMQNTRFYPWEEANGKGKIMTDPELADFVSFLCLKISNASNPSIFDPGVGTGNLLSAFYDRLKSTNPELPHNDILSQLHGRETDVFLGKLGVFNLIMRSPREITDNTSIDIRLEDFFETAKPDIKKHDIVVMNPPFLRTDNKVIRLHREAIEAKIKNMQNKESVMASVSQPNLFYYFVELATKVVKNNGIGCFFIMSSALNTSNGKHLKQFLLDHFEIKYIIKCPRVFFTNYMVSPCIIIGKRATNPSFHNTVKFVRIHTPNFFNSDYSELEREDISNGDLKITSICQGNLEAEDNWKKHLLSIPAFYDTFHSSGKFLPLKKIFGKIKRGQLANQGNGSQFFFPWSNGGANETLGADVINNIENQFKQYGLERSSTPNHYLLDDSALTKEQCLSIKKDVDISKYRGLDRFIKEFDKNYTRPRKWNIDDMESKAQLIIPRAIRKTHAVLLNPYWFTKNVYFSTNFICCWDCNEIEGISIHSVLGFVAGFLNSSFGQIMFEIESQDREGLRKIEKGTIADKILIPITDLSSSKKEMKSINDAFLKLNYNVTGIDDDETREKLDLIVAEILLKHEPEFRSFAASPESLKTLAREFLTELVRDRCEV